MFLVAQCVCYFWRNTSLVYNCVQTMVNGMEIPVDRNHIAASLHQRVYTAECHFHSEHANNVHTHGLMH